MTKYTQYYAQEDGWSKEIFPVPNYKIACCDCGLVHDMDIKVFKVAQHFPGGTFTLEDEPLSFTEFKVMWKVRRNKRATGQMRRKKKV